MSSSTTPLPAESSHRRSASRNNPPSRPTTPIRPTSRTSFRGSASAAHTPSRPQPYASSLNANATPLESLEPAFAELSDSMADLEANFMHLQLMHESLARFSESFAAFLYGLNMNAFCVDFPEAPLPESFKRQRLQEQAREAVARMSMGGAGVSSSRARGGGGLESGNEADTEATFMTTDTSFVENPPSSRAPSKFQTPAPSRTTRGGMRGGASGIARGRGRGGIPRAGGIPRGIGRARGGRG